MSEGVWVEEVRSGLGVGGRFGVGVLMIVYVEIFLSHMWHPSRFKK